MLGEDDGIVPLEKLSWENPERRSGLDLCDCSNDSWLAASYRWARPSDDSFPGPARG